MQAGILPNRCVMIEVFKTNITSREDAEKVIASIHNTFTGYKANFDLWDCDNILRIQTVGEINISALLPFLAEQGCLAEVLPDEPLPISTIRSIVRTNVFQEAG